MIMSHNSTVYKGSSISTTKDCCGVGILPKDIIAGIKNAMKLFSPGVYVLSNKLEKNSSLFNSSIPKHKIWIRIPFKRCYSISYAIIHYNDSCANNWSNI